MDKIQFLPLFEGETTEIKIWKTPIDEKYLSNNFRLPLPKIFEEERVMRVIVKTNRNKNKSQKSINLEGTNNTSFDSNLKTEHKKLFTITGPKNSKMNLSTPGDSHTPQESKSKTSVSHIKDKLSPGKVVSIRSPYQPPGTAKLSVGRHFFPDQIDFSSILGSQSEITRSTRTTTLQKPSDSCIFKGYFELDPSEIKELESENIKTLITGNDITKFIRVFILNFMKFCFEDEFEKGLVLTNQCAETILNNKIEGFYAIVPYIIKVKVLLIYYIEIRDHFLNNLDLDRILYSMHFIAFAKITDQIFMIAMIRALPWFIKAENLEMSKSIIDKIETVSL